MDKNVYKIKIITLSKIGYKGSKRASGFEL